MTRTAGAAKRWTADACAGAYVRLVGRPVIDDARLGWALAVRAFLGEQARRGFANLARPRALEVDGAWPAWVEAGVVALREAFETYRTLDPSWGLLADWPTIANDVGAVGGGVPEAIARLPEVVEASRRAARELDLSRGARARDDLLRAFHAGVSMRRPEIRARELNLLAIAVGLEPAVAQLDPGRRRWADRTKRWALTPQERDRLAGLAAADLLLDARGAVSLEGLLEPFGVSTESRGPFSARPLVRSKPNGFRVPPTAAPAARGAASLSQTPRGRS